MSKDTTGNAGSETWRPIETAPKDRRVLLHCEIHGILTGDYSDDPAFADGDEWWDSTGSFSLIATHWMPLPDPPDTTEAP